MSCFSEFKFLISTFTRYPLQGKPYFLFPDVLKRWSFQKKSRWNMTFLALSGKMIFVFPEDMILYLSRKMKDDCSPKKYMEIRYFLQTFWKDGLFKNGLAGTWSFRIIWNDGIFFPKTWFFFHWAESERRFFSGKIWKYDIFCVHVSVLQTWCHTPLSKNSKMVLSRKNTPKRDWRSRLTS